MISAKFLRVEWVIGAAIIALILLKLFGTAPARGSASTLQGGIEFIVHVGLILMCAFRALHHADILAERAGEPFGTLILTLSILSIEVSLIASVMLTGSADPTLARDTMFAGFMLTMNGVVGLVVLVGGLRFKQQEFNLEGARAYLAALIPLAVAALVLPKFSSTGNGTLTDVQAISIGLATIIFYAIFLGVQTMRHREFFVSSGDGRPVARTQETPEGEVIEVHSLMHFAVLVAALIVIALLGRELAEIVDDGIHRLGIPVAIGGILIAVLTLTPESVSAFRAALQDRLQHSINVFLGGALSTIGLTVPCVLLLGVIADRRVVLGLRDAEMVLLLLTLFVSSMTFGGVRTNVLQGAVHLLIFFLYLVLIVSP